MAICLLQHRSFTTAEFILYIGLFPRRLKWLKHSFIVHIRFVTMAPGIQIQTAHEVTTTSKSKSFFQVQSREIDDSDLESEDGDFPLPPKSKEPTEILGVDKDTPDSHIPRDSRLIRLTGVHPFNVEAPLTALYDEGTSPAFKPYRFPLLTRCKH